jgi:hypothetical protein
LLPLLFILSGCYTILSNPLKISPKPKLNNHIEMHNDSNEYLPMVNRSYGQQLQQPYSYYDNGYYPINSYYYNRYNTYSTHHIHDISQSPASQIQNTVTPEQQNFKVEVKETLSGKDVERAKLVWNRRTNPRAIKTPTPTRRQKDGE